MAHRPWHKEKGIRDITYDKDLGWQIDEKTWSSEYPILSKVLGLQYGERFEQFKKDLKNTPSPSRSPVSRNIEALVKSPIVQEELPEALKKVGTSIKKLGSDIVEADRIGYQGKLLRQKELVELGKERDLARARALFEADAYMDQRQINLYLANATESQRDEFNLQRALNTKENTANEDPKKPKNEPTTSVDKSLEQTDSWYQRNQGESEDDYQARLQGLEEQGNPGIPGGDDDYGTKGKPSGSGPKPPGIGQAVKDHLLTAEAAKGAAIGGVEGLRDYILYWSRYS